MKTGELSGGVFSPQWEKIFSCSHGIRKGQSSGKIAGQNNCLETRIPFSIFYGMLSPARAASFVKQISVVLMACVAFVLVGCGTVPDHTKLRNGMTRGSVLDVMGKPDTSTVSGEIETLEYKSIEWLPPENSLASKTVVDQVKLRNGVVFSLRHFNETPPSQRPKFPEIGLPAGRIVTVSENQEATQNKVVILSVVPETAQPGVPTKFVVRVAYSFQSPEKAAVALMFNTKSPASYSVVGKNIISAGSGVIEYSVIIVPRIWSSGAPFRAMAFLTANEKLFSQSSQDIKLGN